MDKLLSARKVQETLRSSVNIDHLVPQLVKNELLTPDEFRQLCDRHGLDEEKRIRYLITILSRKGKVEYVKRFINSLENACEHTGHRDILQDVKKELISLGLTVDADEVANGVTLNSDRKRTHMQDDYERDSTNCKRPKRSQTLPNVVSNFTSRQDELELAIEPLLQESNTQILSVVGLPAIGKSQFAIRLGHHLQQQLKYGVFYHDFVNAIKLNSDEFSYINGHEHQCLILDNIDSLLHDTQQNSALLTSLQHITSHHKIKIITTSCKVFRGGQVNIKSIRILPFSEAESKSYMQDVMNRYSEQDITPVIEACAGIPLALRCAAENINSTHWDVKDFCCDDEDNNVMEALHVETFGHQSLNQVNIRFQNKLSLLAENHQENLKGIVNDTQRLQNLSPADKRSLYNSGWLEKREDGNLFLNGLLQSFLRENFRSRAHP